MTDVIVARRICYSPRPPKFPRLKKTAPVRRPTPYLQAAIAGVLIAGARAFGPAGKERVHAFLWSDPFLLMAAMFALVGAVEAAKPGSPVGAEGRLFNAAYAVTHLFFAFLIGVPLAAASAWAIRSFGSGWIDLRALGLGGWGGGLIAVVVSALVQDFFFYWFHRLEHASSFFWQPHLIHHSDENVNATTAARGHILETLLLPVFVSIPMAVLFNLPPARVGLLSLAPFAWLYVAHANVKLDFGPLWWMAVSPAYHRIHHSLEKKHMGKNFANWFPVWDIAFGTALKPRRGEWPVTGVADVKVDTLWEAYALPLRAWSRMLVAPARRAGAVALIFAAAALLGLPGRARASFTFANGSYNAQNNAIATIVQNGGAAWTQIQNRFYSLGSGAGTGTPIIGTGLAQMGGTNFGVMPLVGNAATGAQTGAAFNRMVALREGFEGGDRVASGGVSGAQRYPGVLLADAIGDTGTGLLADASKPLGFYGSIVGADGRQFGANLAPGYNFNAEGFSLGGDYRVADGAAVGVSLAYMRDHASVDQGDGTTDGNSYRYGVYGTLARNGWYGDAYVGGGWDFFSNERQMGVLGLSAGSAPQAHELNARLGAGYDARVGRFIVSPFASLTLDRLYIGSYGETGAGPADLNVNANTIKSTKGALGFRFKCGGDKPIKPYLSIAYQHEFDSRDQSLTSQFAASATSFATQLAQPSQEAVLVGLGLDAQVAKDVTARVSYDGEFRSDYVSHSLNGNVRLKF